MFLSLSLLMVAMRLSNDIVQNPELQLQTQTAWSHVLVNALADKVQEKLKCAITSGKHDALLSSTSGQDHLVYKLTADALKLKGNERIKRVLSKEQDDTAAIIVGDIYQDADDDAAQQVRVWAQNAHLYQSPGNMHGNREYQKWADKEVKTENALDYVPGLIEVLDKRFRLQMVEVFDRVRTADYKPMEKRHIPAVVDSYMRSWLDEKALSLLVKVPGMSSEQITEQIRTFREKVNKGVFIWPLKEEELEADLDGAAQKRTGMELRGRVLEAQDGKLLCWATYYHAPNKPTNRHIQTVTKYFRRGVTGAKMQIEDPDIRNLVMENLPYIELFQDIRSLYPYAADRLGMMLFDEMHKANANLKFVTAYRLGNVEPTPKLELLDEAWRTSVYPVENESSARKFGNWGVRHIAWDFNPHAVPSVREDVEGIPGGRLELRPRWDVMHGNIHEVVPKSRAVWRNIQTTHGDLSADPFPQNWKF